MGSLAGDMETSCDPPPYLVQPTFSNRRFSYMITQSVTLARLQQGATRDEVLCWLLGRPFALTIPPSITQRAREYFQSAYEESSRQHQKGSRTPKGTTKNRP